MNRTANRWLLIALSGALVGVPVATAWADGGEEEPPRVKIYTDADEEPDRIETMDGDRPPREAEPGSREAMDAVGAFGAGVALEAAVDRDDKPRRAGGLPKMRPLDGRSIAPWDHFELSMGFLAGERSYGRGGFAHSEGGGGDLGTLVEPFRRAPFDRVPVTGLRYDVRLVVSYVRMTVGVDIPFAVYDADQTVATYTVNGAPAIVRVRSIRPFSLRFGIGAEIPVGPVAPFVDVVGGLNWVKATLDVEGAEVSYGSFGFGFSGRAGVRLHVRKWFFAAAAGEIGIIGDVRWGAELSVGFALM